MDNLHTMPQAELDTTDHPTSPNNSQNATSTKVTLELRKYILLLASLVATVTYAPGFSPPGDVWQDTADGHIAGDPIIRETHHKRYLAFFYCNATAFVMSFVVIFIALALTCLDEYKDKYSGSNIAIQYMKRQGITIRTLQLAMVLDLLSLMGAYAAGTSQDTFTTIYSSVLVGLVFLYLVIQMAVAALVSVASSPGGVPEQDKSNNHRKVLMLLATFVVSITYLAGLSSPGGFWDSAGAGHRPGDAILKDHHSTRLAVFFTFNTLAFVASLLIIVVLLDTKPHHHLRHGFIVVTLLSLIVAYNAGSCRQTNTTVYEFCLIAAVLLFILLLLWVTRSFNLEEPQTPSTRPGVPQAQHANGRESKTLTEKAKAEDKARSVLLLATLAATITYQAGLDPPGGVWQDNSGGHTAGDPILLTTGHRRYNAFFYCNSVSLVASLIAIVLVQEKSLLNHHVLEAVIILDLFGLIGAYAAGSCWDVKSSIYAMAFTGAFFLVFVVIPIIFFTLADDTRTRSESDKENDNELVEKKRKRLLNFAILAATITYQAGLTPPGGFLLKDDQTGHAGDPVMVFHFPNRYKAFFYCNLVSFMLSIALILLLINPKLYRPAIRTHASSVCTVLGLFCLIGAYAAGSTQYLDTSIYLLALVGVLQTIITQMFLVFSFAGWSKTREAHQETEMGRTQDNKEEDKHIKKNKLHAKRKYLMLLGILVASVTYQAGLEPPGGAWTSNSGGYEAGNPVMQDNRRPQYLAFFYSNSTSFMASIVVILLLMVPENQLVGNSDQLWSKRWLVVMNTTIVLDLLGLLGAYAAGSSRQWKTSVYVLLLVIAVLAYMAFHLLLARIIRKKRASGANDTP